jgi:hypothetical protein
MRRSPNPWPIGLREPNPAGARETRFPCCGMEASSGQASVLQPGSLRVCRSERRKGAARDQSPIIAVMSLRNDYGASFAPERLQPAGE